MDKFTIFVSLIFVSTFCEVNAHGSNSTRLYNPDNALEQLVPALIQCFGVTLLGYIAGRWGILSELQAQGLSSFVTKFALPSVFFRVLVGIDFSGVCWLLVVAVSVSKLIAFVIGIVFSLLLSRQLDLGMAAIVAIFVSQSNDVALAYPILNALYPELASYIYLFAPTQLVLLNPFAYFMLEWHRSKLMDGELEPLVKKSDSDSPTKPVPKSSRSPGRRVLKVLWHVVKNPLFFMTAIGVIFNLILKHQLPIYIDGILKIIADAFAATALFSLGFGMVGKMNRITKREMYILVVILLMKLVILPFITREVVVQMMPSGSANQTLRYSTFGFLYGSIPTAPPVYLFAAEYQVIPVAIGVGLVLGTCLCGPMMFILAHMVTMYLADPSDYDQLLGNTVTNISWISIACCIWTVCIMFLGRKAFRIPHRFTLCYSACVLLSCIGVVAGHLLNTYAPLPIPSEYVTTLNSLEINNDLLSPPAKWVHYIQFTLFFIGCCGARFWTSMIACALFLQRARSTCFVLRYEKWFYMFGFATPVLVTGILLLTSSGQRVKDIDPAFQYGQNQMIVSAIVLLLNTVVTLSFLIAYVRIGDRLSADSFIEIAESPNVLFGQEATALQTSSPKLQHGSIEDTAHRGQPGTSRYCGHCEPGQKHKCARMIASYSRLTRSPSSSHQDSTLHPPTSTLELGDCTNPIEPHQHRHIVLLILLLITMFFGICLCAWRLVHEAPSGIYIVLEFLDGAFNFGQGIILFTLFGLDADLIILPIKRCLTRWTTRLLGSILESVGSTPSQSGDQLSSSLLKQKMDQIVHQFVTFHLTSCSSAICKDLNVNSIQYMSVFTDRELAQWLQQAGITDGPEDTAFYIRSLEQGNVVRTIGNLANDSSSDQPDDERILNFTKSAWLHSPTSH